MKRTITITPLILILNFVNAQDRDFFENWFVGFPTTERVLALCKYGQANANFKVIEVVSDSSCHFLLDGAKWIQAAPKSHPINSDEIDSASVNISTGFIPSIAYDRPRRHHIGRIGTITVEYYLKSKDSISGWTDRLIRKALDFKCIYAAVYPENSIQKYHYGEFLLVDNPKQFRRIEIMENYYVTGITSILVSYEFEL